MFPKPAYLKEPRPKRAKKLANRPPQALIRLIMEPEPYYLGSMLGPPSFGNSQTSLPKGARASLHGRIEPNRPPEESPLLWAGSPCLGSKSVYDSFMTGADTLNRRWPKNWAEWSLSGSFTPLCRSVHASCRQLQLIQRL